MKMKKPQDLYRQDIMEYFMTYLDAEDFDVVDTSTGIGHKLYFNEDDALYYYTLTQNFNEVVLHIAFEHKADFKIARFMNNKICEVSFSIKNFLDFLILLSMREAISPKEAEILAQLNL
jgi:hypothetical protein